VSQIPLLLLWTFACHNSIWTFLVGIPFERALFWHKFMVWLSLGLGLHHGILGQLGQGEDDSTRVTGTAMLGKSDPANWFAKCSSLPTEHCCCYGSNTSMHQYHCGLSCTVRFCPLSDCPCSCGFDLCLADAGWVLEAIMGLLVLLSLRPVRRAFFELPHPLATLRGVRGSGCYPWGWGQPGGGRPVGPRRAHPYLVHGR